MLCHGLTDGKICLGIHIVISAHKYRNWVTQICHKTRVSWEGSLHELVYFYLTLKENFMAQNLSVYLVLNFSMPSSWFFFSISETELLIIKQETNWEMCKIISKQDIDNLSNNYVWEIIWEWSFPVHTLYFFNIDTLLVLVFYIPASEFFLCRNWVSMTYISYHK